MKRALVLLIMGTVLSGIAAFAATARAPVEIAVAETDLTTK